jgi:hypothetical protein
MPVLLVLAACGAETSGGGTPGAPDAASGNTDAAVADAGDVPPPPDAAPGPMPDATPTPPDAPGPPVVPVFTRASTEPVFSPDPESGWDNEGVWEPEVIRLGDDSWVMFYAANDNVGPHYAWSRAVSTDGITWTAEGPVWGGQNPSVIHDGTQFRAYVVSYDDGVFQLRSADGLTWELDPGENLAYAYYPTVLRDDAGYKIWFMRGGQFWFATSSDGSTWTEHPDPLAITPQGAAAVIFDEGVYKMWFSQANDGIVYAVSPDGIAWEVLGTSLAAGEMGDWDRYVWSPHVIRDGDVLKMWFTGSWWIFPDYYDPRIGYATSP